MESTELVKYDNLNKVMPLKGIPEEKLNTIILMELMPYLSNLLSLTDETSAKRLETALPAIKVHCWSMGFAEIVKMHHKYVDNKLSIKAIPNYYDRILLGKIVESYKQQKPIKKQIFKQMTPEEKEFKMIEATDRVKKEFKQHGRIIEMCHHVYDYLFELGKLPKDKAYKDAIFTKALELRKSELIQQRAVNGREIRDLIKNIKKGKAVINIAKRLVLEDYFKKLNHVNK